MWNNDYTLLIVSYVIIGIMVASVAITSYLKRRKVSGMDIVRVMYFIIYSVVPISTLLAVNKGELAYKLRSLDLSEYGIFELQLMAVFSFVGYIALELGNSTNFVIRKNHRNNITHDNLIIERTYSCKKLHSAAVVMTLISIIALLLWASTLGGLRALLNNGRLVRSGYTVEGTTNSLGFMKMFVPFGLFASVVFGGLYRTEKKGLYLIEFGMTFFISVFYSVANDGRAPFMMYLVSLLVLWRMTSKVELKRKNIFSLFVIVLVAYLLISNMDNILNLLRSGSYGTAETDSGVFSFLADEFSFTVRNAQSSQEALKDGETFRVFKDILGAAFSLVPSRFRPDWVVRLEKVNTQYWVGAYTYYGGKPTDLMAASLYELWYFGIVIWPFIYGVVVKKLDKYFNKQRDTLYGKILFVQLIYQFAKTVAYADLWLIAWNIFYIVLCHLIVLFFCPRIKTIAITSGDINE